MWRRAAALVIMTCTVVPECASAAIVDVLVTDTNRHTAESAVVVLAPEAPVATASRALEKAVIDQRHEMFIPLAVVIRRGGVVVFTNNDVTKHQVYSFSPIKQFQFVIGQGETSDPVQFDQTGVAAIGCNIHDRMIAYVLVTDAPFAATTDSGGRSTIVDVPDGKYRLSVWHPQMKGAAPEPGRLVEVKGAHVELTAVIPVSIETGMDMKHMHMDY
jgi:plastocyanin